MSQFLPPAAAIAGACFAVAVCLAAGRLLLRGLQLEFHQLENELLAFISGAACVSLAVFFLCLVHAARLPVFLAGGVLLIAAAVRFRGQLKRPPLPGTQAIWQVIFWLVFAAFFLCYFLNALSPEISPDGSGYHLGNVARYWRNGGFDWSYHSIYSSMPQGMEMLFLVAFSIGRHSAAALVHFAFQSALPLLVFCYGRRFGSPRAGAFAAILVYTSPIAGIAGTSAYNDLTVATFLFAEFYLLQVKDKLNNRNTLLLNGLLAGFAVTVKYTAWLAYPVAVIVTRARRLPTLTAGAVLMAAPWLIRNWIWIGNPVAPFLNSWFPNPYWTAAAERGYLDGLRHYPNFKSYWEFCSQVTVLGGLVPGMLGPAFLLAPVALLALRSSQGRRLLAAGAVFALPALLNIEVRFLIPALPFCALALGIALENSWGALPAVALVEAILCWPSVMDLYCDRNAWRVRGLQWRTALRIEPESAYISSHVGDYALRGAIAQSAPPSTSIFSFAGRAAAYIDRDVIVGYESSLGIRLGDTLQAAASTGNGRRAAALAAKGAGVGFLLINSTDDVATDMRDHSKEWGLTEVSKANGITLYRID